MEEFISEKRRSNSVLSFKSCNQPMKMLRILGLVGQSWGHTADYTNFYN